MTSGATNEPDRTDETGGDTIDLPAAERPRMPLARGTSVGRYFVIDCIGEGGMGVVYKAYDPELERAVALKLLHATAEGSTAPSTRRERLLREAKALARLSHPNVLAVFDVGTFEDDVFIATEFVEGPTLGAWLKEAKRARGEVIAAFVAAGEGLAAAHRAGLVHRDFKPSNVLVGKDGRVRVLDFGLARSEGATAVDVPAHESVPIPTSVPPQAMSPPDRAVALPSILDTTITAFGQILGTPRFMAPEQHLGRTADARSDQFAFCVSLYEALYADFPYDGRGDEYARNVVQGKLKAPPAGSDVPRWLRAVVVRGLATDPAARFASMDDLLRELRRDVGAARRRWIAIAAGAVALVGIALGVRHARPAETPCGGAEKKLGGVWDDSRKRAVHDAFAASGAPGADDAWKRTEATLDDYARRWVGAHVDACEATRVRGEQSAELLDLRMECLGERLEELRAQVDVFARADATTVGKAVQASHALPRLDACDDAAALRAPIRPPSDEARAKVDAVRAAIARGKAMQRSARYDEALGVATKASGDATALGYAPLEAEALYLLGDLQDDEGEYGTAERTLDQSVARAIAGKHDTVQARALTALVAEIGLRQARFAEAHEWATVAEAAADRVSDPFVRGEFQRNLGRLFIREGKYDDGGRAIGKCLAIWEPALGRDDFAVAGAVTDLGNVYFELGRYEEAIAQYARSLAIQEKLMGPDSTLLAANSNNEGEVYLAMGEWERAAPPLERALALWSRLGAEHPKVALASSNLAAARLHAGDLDGARALAERAVAIWRKALGNDHPDVAIGLHVVAEVARARRDWDGALGAEQDALAIREAKLGAKSAEAAESLASIGETRLAMGRDALAIAPLERAVANLEGDRVDPMDLAVARFDLARAVAGAQRDRAIDLATKARATFAAGTSRLAKERTREVDEWLRAR